MPRYKTIGIIGGMGPHATNRLCELITDLTPASCDQQHIPVITFNNSAIPNRVDAISANGPSALPELIRTATVLEAAGADFLLMPCNTAHYYLKPLREAVSIPIIDMVQTTVEFVKQTYPELERIGIIGSTATLESELYQRWISSLALKQVTPDDVIQSEIMTAIFGADGIKAGKKDSARKAIISAASHLVRNGAQCIVAGCTEVSLVLEDGDLTVPVIDPLSVLASFAISFAKAGLNEPQKACLTA